MNPINIQLSPQSLNQGEQAILKEIALQLYAQNIFNFAQARRLAKFISVGISRIFSQTENSASLY